MINLTPVLLESPYAGDIERNERYARACIRHCFLEYLEAAFASHLLYTQAGILDDLVPEERELGIVGGLAWGQFAVRSVVFTDLGISNGMQRGISDAFARGRPVVYRTLPGWRG